MLWLLGVVVLVVLLLVFVVLTYNGLVRRRNQVDNAWSQVDVQLTRRYELIPNLVETVRGYARHEQETFDRVTRARAQALGAQGPVAQAEADDALTGALKSLFAVSEAYPDLKASGNFRELQQELANTEDRTAYARPGCTRRRPTGLYPAPPDRAVPGAARPGCTRRRPTGRQDPARRGRGYWAGARSIGGTSSRAEPRR